MSEEQIASLYKTIFSTPDGKLCLQDIKDRAYRNAPIAIDALTKTLVEPNQLYLNAGMQLLCLHIEGQIEYQPTVKEEFPND
jgi:hypothetical protein